VLSLRPTPRALAIAEGLVRTGRATRLREADNHIVLRSKASGFYWVAFDGESVRPGRGDHGYRAAAARLRRSDGAGRGAGSRGARVDGINRQL
jgi:hypothetical protein